MKEMRANLRSKVVQGHDPLSATRLHNHMAKRIDRGFSSGVVLLWAFLQCLGTLVSASASAHDSTRGHSFIGFADSCAGHRSYVVNSDEEVCLRRIQGFGKCLVGHVSRELFTQHNSDGDGHCSVARTSGSGNIFAPMCAYVSGVHLPGQPIFGAHSHLEASEHGCTGYTDAVTKGVRYAPPFHALSLALRTHGVSFDTKVWVRHILGHARHSQAKLRHVSCPLGQAEGKWSCSEMFAGICNGHIMHPCGHVFGASPHTWHALSIAKRTGMVIFDTDVWVKRTQHFRDIQEEERQFPPSHMHDVHVRPFVARPVGIGMRSHGMFTHAHACTDWSHALVFSEVIKAHEPFVGIGHMRASGQLLALDKISTRVKCVTHGLLAGDQCGISVDTLVQACFSWSCDVTCHLACVSPFWFSMGTFRSSCDMGQ